MIEVLLSLWVVCALLIIYEQKVIRIIIYFCIFSLITSVCYFVLGAPDVALAEGSIGAFIIVFFITCFEKYYGLVPDLQNKPPAVKKRLATVKQYIAPLVFTVFLFGLFLFFIPAGTASTYLKNQYVSLFMRDIGGENAVTAIYLGYRVYDTLLEALMLLVAVIAVFHVSWRDEHYVPERKESPLNRSNKAVFIIRNISPLLLLFGIYLVVNGYRSPGGGFQGGVLIASFFICRYKIYGLYDINVDRLINIEKLSFIILTLLAVFVVFFGFTAYFRTANVSLMQSVYLISMNALIGLKVACGFVVLFYRYVAVERK